MSGSQTTTKKAAPNTHAANADPLLNLEANGGACPVETTPAGPGVATYDSAPLPEQATMIGATRATVRFSATSSLGQVQMNARLYDVFPDGTALMVDRGPRRITDAELLAGKVSYELHGNGWRFPARHKIRIELAQDDDPYIKSSTVPSTVNISSVALDIPVREGVFSTCGVTATYCRSVRNEPGLQAYYRLNVGGSWAWGKDTSGNDYQDAQGNSGTSYPNPGLTGDTDTAQRNPNFSFQDSRLRLTSQPYTVEFWFNPIGAAGYTSVLVNNPGTFNIGQGNYSPGNGRAVYFTRGSGTVSGFSPVGGQWTTPGWRHVAMTYDGGTMCAYINGQYAFGNSGNSCVASSGALDGSALDRGAYLADSGYDEDAFYDRALTRAQIAAHYAAR